MGTGPVQRKAPATSTVHEDPSAPDGDVLQPGAVDLTTAGRALQTAQRQGDVDALDALLHPRVVASGPDGEVFTEADDLDSHRSGALRVVGLVEESLDVEEGTTTGRTRTTAFGGGWRVLAATFAPAQGSTGCRPARPPSTGPAALRDGSTETPRPVALSDRRPGALRCPAGTDC